MKNAKLSSTLSRAGPSLQCLSGQLKSVTKNSLASFSRLPPSFNCSDLLVITILAMATGLLNPTSLCYFWPRWLWHSLAISNELIIGVNGYAAPSGAGFLHIGSLGCPVMGFLIIKYSSSSSVYSQVITTLKLSTEKPTFTFQTPVLTKSIETSWLRSRTSQSLG